MEHNYGGDRERVVKKGVAWEKFKQFLKDKDPDVDIGKILHRHKVKREPAISYGIIEFVKVDNKILYHVYRKRNTMEYDILIRGFAQKNQLFDMICLLSEDERYKILNNTWEEIWDDYWVDHNDGSYVSLRSQSMRRFPEIKELLTLISNDVDFKIKNRPYIFPKGKPNKYESGLEAAFREAREETGSRFDDGYLYFNSPIIQQYVGSDGLPYIDYYYVWTRSTIYASPIRDLTQPTPYMERKNSPKGSMSRWDSLFKKIETQSNLNSINQLDQDNIDSVVSKTIWPNSPPGSPIENERLRTTTISHELESDAWLELPIFRTVREQQEWQNSIDAYEEFGLFKRHFSAILEIHSHLV